MLILGDFLSNLQVFQQIPGTLLVKGSVQDKNSPLSGFLQIAFPQLFFIILVAF